MWLLGLYPAHSQMADSDIKSHLVAFPTIPYTSTKPLPEYHHSFARPIEQVTGNSHWIARSYPYGSTQWQRRAVHLGVEFVNPRHTPVLAAQDGRVIFAADDSERMLGPRLRYYGNTVILAHDMQTPEGQPLFTLYGHLEAVFVRERQLVQAGQHIATVGDSGIAIGPHLHFEVRAGDPFDARNTRNPELWLRHYPGHGMIVGSVLDDEGQPLYGKRLIVRSGDWQREIFTYGSDTVNPDPLWHENFTVGDLPAGAYQVLALKENGAIAYSETIQVLPMLQTHVNIVIPSSPPTWNPSTDSTASEA